jgi:hypothetical protein
VSSGRLFEYFIRERVQKHRQRGPSSRSTTSSARHVGGQDRITGARVQAAARTGDKVIDADLVVDATGRGSRTPVWLEQLGYERPRGERKKIDLGLRDAALQAAPRRTDFVRDDVAINQIASRRRPPGNVFFKVRATARWS